jgi:hypothetical protein
MKRFFYMPCLLAVACALLSSCLKNEEQEVTLYNDAAITSFVLGKISYKHPITGAETTLTGSLYPMAIDQLKDSIYNRTYLPGGSNISSITCTVTARNGGGIALKNLDDDLYTWYNSSTPIDFTQVRQFRILSTDGSYYRDYKVKVNVRDAQSAYWVEKGDTTLFAGMSNMRILAPDTTLVILGQDSDITHVFTSSDKGETWNLEDTEFDANAWQNALIIDERVYVLSNNKLYSSKDMKQWTSVDNSWNLKQLVAAGSEELFALTADSTLKATTTDDLTKWTDEVIDQSLSADSAKHMLALESISSVSFPYGPLSNTDYVLLLGRRNGATVSWRKISQYEKTGNTGKWVNIPAEGINNYLLPEQEKLSLLVIGGTIYAVGDGTTVYVSTDQGITWREKTLYELPQTMQAATADNDGVMWAVSTDETGGKVWRGSEY